jgi:predicted HAD superfamily phosphohydrolase YqeG
LKYHISENNKRLYEDSLVTQFDKYFYNKNSDITVERMKKFGLKYLLVDLNAATIDQDPRHNLTTRYEKLLKTFTSTELELVETDSMCLKI